MTRTEISEDDVGHYYVDETNQVWQCISFTRSPTATLQKVGTEEARSGCVGSQILSRFTRLVPKQESEIPVNCSECGRPLNGYHGPRCRYCDGTAE